MLNHLEDKTKALAVKYRSARKALLELLGLGDWERSLHQLTNGDLTMPDGIEISIDDLTNPKPNGRQRTAARLGLGQGKKAVS